MKLSIVNTEDPEMIEYRVEAEPEDDGAVPEICFLSGVHGSYAPLPASCGDKITQDVTLVNAPAGWVRIPTECGLAFVNPASISSMDTDI